MGDIIRDIFLAFVRVHLLHHAAEGRIYGLEMLQELARHGYDLSPGTLYPIFHSLEADGYLVSEQEVVGGRIRKYYRATDPGRQLLAELRPKISELVKEVLGEAPAGPWPGRSSEMANSYPESNPLHHTTKVRGMLGDLVQHLRQDVDKISDPSAKALFETSAEVLNGLAKAYDDFEKKNEDAWK